MGNAKQALTGPLAKLSVQDIKHLLRGFPDTAISSALVLRTTFDISVLEDCLHGILQFYLPEGAEGITHNDSGKIRIKEDIGLDSLSIAESMFKIEELFDVPIEFNEIAEVETIADASRMLTQKMTIAESIAV